MKLETSAPGPPEFDAIGRLAKAIASPRRLAIVDALAHSERSVEDLARLTGASVANASQHLQTLLRMGLVGVRRAGLNANYRLESPHVFAAWQGLRDLARH